MPARPFVAYFKSIAPKEEVNLKRLTLLHVVDVTLIDMISGHNLDIFQRLKRISKQV